MPNTDGDKNSPGLAKHTPALSPDDRVALATAIGALIGSPTATDTHRQQAHAILGALSSDAVVGVRAALANAIAEYPLLPAKLAQTLAADVADVAVPLLRCSEALGDDFLLDLLCGSLDRSDKELIQASIASRAIVSAAVSTKILSDGAAVAVETVLSNSGAVIADDGYSALFARNDLNGQMLSLAARRTDLSAISVEKCHALVLTDLFERRICQDVRNSLIEKYALPAKMADDIVQAAQEDALSRAAGSTDSNARALAPLVEQLRTHGDLTPTLLLRMACHRSIPFVAAALGALTENSEETVATAIEGAGTDALNELYIASGLAGYFRFAVVAAIKRMSATPQGPTRAVDLVVRDIVGFYRGIAPAPIDQVIAHLTQEAERWQGQ